MRSRDASLLGEATQGTAPDAPVGEGVTTGSAAPQQQRTVSARQIEATDVPAPVPPQSGVRAELPAGPLPREPVHYSTVVPPSAKLRFRLRRGSLQGNAELDWQVQGERYQLRMESTVAGAPVLVQLSQGGFDADGLAPQRFTDQRARRGTRAVNFQRDAGKISFSAVSAELELGSGVQDRLSWLVQLAAIASAEPQRLAARGEISLPVVGARAEQAWWHFVSMGEERLDTAQGPLQVFRLQRPAGAEFDTQVEVWLQAQAPHWPVRAEWRNGPNDPGVELWLSGPPELR